MDLRKIDSTGIEPEGGVPNQEILGGNGITALKGIATGDEGLVVTNQIDATRDGAFESSILKGILTDDQKKPSTDVIAAESVPPAEPVIPEKPTPSPKNKPAEAVRLAQQNLVNRVVKLLIREENPAATFVARNGMEFLVSKLGLEILEKWEKFLRILKEVEKKPKLLLSHELERNFCPKKISDIRDKKRHARTKATYTGDYPGRKSLTVPADTNFLE